jgi:hypothetical protein
MASKPIKRPRLAIDVTPEIHRQAKMRASMENMTISQWILELILGKLNETQDVRVALERLSNLEGSISLEEFHQELLKAEQQGNP